MPTGALPIETGQKVRTAQPVLFSIRATETLLPTPLSFSRSSVHACMLLSTASCHHSRLIFACAGCCG